MQDIRADIVFFSCHQVRRWFYLLMNIPKYDIETQRKGAVIIFHMMGGLGPASWTISERFRYSILTHAVPVMFSAVHICYDSELWRPMLTLSKLVVDRHSTMRLREHCCKYYSHCPSWFIDYSIDRFQDSNFIAVVHSRFSPRSSLQIDGLWDSSRCDTHDL